MHGTAMNTTILPVTFVWMAGFGETTASGAGGYGHYGG